MENYTLTREDLSQYSSMQSEIKEIQGKINRLENDIARLKRRLTDIECNGELVRDKVSGGYGGTQSFVIEGFPTVEYKDIKTKLLTKKMILSGRKSTLDALEIDLLQKTNEIEEFIASIDDSRIRRIVNLRYVEGMSWVDVATAMGGGNTEDTVRKAFERFMKF